MKAFWMGGGRCLHNLVSTLHITGPYTSSGELYSIWSISQKKVLTYKLPRIWTVPYTCCVPENIVHIVGSHTCGITITDSRHLIGADSLETSSLDHPFKDEMWFLLKRTEAILSQINWVSRFRMFLLCHLIIDDEENCQIRKRRQGGSQIWNYNLCTVQGPEFGP